MALIESGPPVFLYVRPYAKPEKRLARITAVPGWGHDLCASAALDVIGERDVALLMLDTDLGLMLPNERPSPIERKRTRVISPQGMVVIEGRFLLVGVAGAEIMGLRHYYVPRLRYLHPMGKDRGPGVLTWATEATGPARLRRVEV